MKPWNHLAAEGLAEKIPHELAEQMFAKMFSMFYHLHPGMSDELVNNIRKRCEVVRFKKRAVILDYNEVCHYCFFAHTGLVKAISVTEGIEQVSWFMGEDDIVIGVDSFYDQEPSEEQLIALEDTDCIALHWDELQFIYGMHDDFNRVGRRLTEYYYRQAMRRTKWVGLPAAKRYQLLFEAYPKFMGRVPDAALASYLGINKATLSRIKRGFRKK
ncbi:Crp/Fnr family transcriptional regulator [Chitinophaga sp.]|uniref:Crp/Fnr family transcriptional regulator n=1 Tax=Chitinophaga sp. TaxID=1869181 RepID=UPI0031E12012